MARIGLAFRLFFRTLSDASFAERVGPLLLNEPVAAPAPASAEAAAPPPRPAAPVKPARSEALTLLAMLQREARFVDFVQESLGGYSDEQIGAAVRDVHRDCAAVVARAFGLQPIVEQAEGSVVESPDGFDAGRYRLTGQVSGQTPRGTLRHHGWEATRCELPAWTGGESAARVIAPAELEIA